MNLILLQQKDYIADDRVKLSGRRFRHALSVLEVSVGKQLQVGLFNGKIGTGTVLSLSDDSFELAVKLDREPPQPPAITVILAMPRPKVFKRVLQGLTAMGVKRIILLNSWKVDKSYWQSPTLAPEAIREQLILGLEQARDTILPIVQIEQRFKPFVEDTLPALANETCALVAHPGSSQPCPVNLQGPVTLAIGPEGGFTSYEVDKLIDAGFTAIHLGERPMRVETAVPALVGRLLPCP